MGKKGEIVGAVDFGSREVRVIIARQSDDGGIVVLGHGSAPARGCVSQGVIQDLAAAQQALKRALGLAEKEANHKVAMLFCGLNGKNVATTIREGRAKLDREAVELGHMDEALDQASREILAANKRAVWSVTSQEWYVDDLRVSDPLGIRGSVVKTRVHFAQMPSAIEENIENCIESQSRELEDVVYLPLAAALGCLTPEDIDLGVCVLDMGHTTTGLALYRERRIIATRSFDFGGFHITRDVAAGLQVSFEEAAELILEYGISDELIRSISDEDDIGEVARELAREDSESHTHIKLKTAVRGAPSIVDRSELDMIIFERSKELFTMVRKHLYSKGLAANLVRGVVLTGGAANIHNMTSLAEAVFEAPVRVGQPDGIDIMPQPVNTPEYAPIIGVARHGFAYRQALRSGRIETRKNIVSLAAASVGAVFSKYFF